VLWDAVQNGDHGRARDLHRRLLPLWNAMVADNLPACTKHAQTVQGCPAGLPRAPMPAASADQRRAVEAALRGLEGHQ
jgi:4-hydroxy-tetrahydrodipicolinate synthase